MRRYQSNAIEIDVVEIRSEGSALLPQVSLTIDEMRQSLEKVFRANACSQPVAAVLADNCASAERDGSRSHGLFRMEGYVSSLRSGWVDGRAEPVIEDCAPGFLRVDARNGFAVPAHHAARDLLEQKVRRNGIAVLAIRDSHHLGAVYLDVEAYAEKGLVALSVVNSMAVVVHPGGRKPVYGTNPVAFAAPRAVGAPLLFDLATSAMAHGDVRAARREGLTLPDGVGIDALGQPTRDPGAILEGGALLPFGGHKGAAVALMVEILCAALVGGRFSHEVDWGTHPGAQTPRTGQTLILIDPSCGSAGLAPFAERVEHLSGFILSDKDSRLPGEKRLASRALAAERSILVDADEWRSILSLGSEPAA